MDVGLQSDNAPLLRRPFVGRKPRPPVAPICLNCEPDPITAATEEPSFPQPAEVPSLVHSTVGIQRQRVIIPTH